MTALLFLLPLLFAQVQASAAQQVPLSYRISGVVVDAMTRVPVPRAEVSIFYRDEETSATASDDGRFSFEGLEAGKYRLYAAARGYVREGYNQHGAFLTAVAVGSGLDSEHVLFRLYPQAMIHGRVTDEHGDAVRGAQIQLFATEQTHRRYPTSLRAQTQTNDLGEYRFAHLLPGKYFLAVQARPWYAQTELSYLPQPEQQGQGTISFGRIKKKPDPLLDVVFPVTFWPSVTDERGAAELNLAAGETEEANIQLGAVPAVHVRLTNLPADENDRVGIAASQELFGFFRAALNVLSGQISPGEYEIAGLPPGDVTFTLNKGGNQEWNPRTITSNVSAGEKLDAADTGAMANVSGRVILPPGTAGSGQGQVTLVSERNQAATAKLLKDGSFSFGPLQADTYKVFVNPSSSGQYVQKVSASGAKTLGRQVTISGTGEVQLNITMARGLGQVTGMARLDGRPVAEAMVLIVPESGENLEEDYRMDQSDSDGTFILANILPGKYTLLAIEDGWELEWMKPEILKPYREKGLTIQIAPNETKKVTVEVQHKTK